MRFYSYIIPSDDELEITKVVYSEEEILAEFWQHWSTEMKGNGYGDLISVPMCIDDWCAMHWATQEDVYKFKEGYDGKFFCLDQFNPNDSTFNWVSLICLNDNSVNVGRWVNLALETIKVE